MRIGCFVGVLLVLLFFFISLKEEERLFSVGYTVLHSGLFRFLHFGN